MLAEERFSEILKLVNEYKTITVQELTELLDMSESTIRRDLTTLHKKGKLIKVHGGATAVNMAQYTRDESVAVRQDLNIDEKVQIVKYASSLIEKDDFLNMIAIAESTPGPMAVNSATYIGYHVAGFYGATAATLAVCIPSFIVIYCISLFFNQFLSLHYITCAFKGIQVCVVYLILTAGIRFFNYGNFFFINLLYFDLRCNWRDSIFL